MYTHIEKLSTIYGEIYMGDLRVLQNKMKSHRGICCVSIIDDCSGNGCA